MAKRAKRSKVLKGAVGGERWTKANLKKVEGVRSVPSRKKRRRTGT